MQKVGRYRAIRNLACGWVTHANHGRDSTERMFHYITELLIIFVAAIAIFSFQIGWLIFAAAAFIIHTVWWVINGNFHVYMLDSFRFVRNAGIDQELMYILWVSEICKRLGVKAVLVYGSFCRKEFHGRSDLDLRIIRDCSASPLPLLFFAVHARVISMLRGCPTDLQVVDSEEFLQRQMSDKEYPVDVFGGATLSKIVCSMRLSDVCENPSIVMKPEREFEAWKK